MSRGATPAKPRAAPRAGNNANAPRALIGRDGAARWRRRWAWIAATLVATACVAFFLRTLDLRATMTQLARAQPAWLVLAVAGHALTLPLLAEQWFRLLPAMRRLRWSALWECVTIGMAAMNTLPFGGGHGVAAGLLVRRGAQIEGAVSLLALEQLCDGVAKLALLLAALAVVPLPGILQRAAWTMAAAIIAGFAGLLWLARHPGQGGWMGRFAARWSHHIEAVRKPGVLAYAIGLSLIAKIAGVAAVYAAQRSLGAHLPASSALVVLAAVTFATLMAVSPGNLGIYEIAAIAAYRLFGLPTNEAAALAVVQHACFLLPNIGIGYGVVVWRTVRPRPRASCPPTSSDHRDGASAP